MNADAPSHAKSPGSSATESSATEPSAPLPVHRDGNVLRWLSAYAASMVGDSVYFLALGWAAAQVAGPAQVGVVMAVGAVPRALLMLGGGVVADRFGPRKVVIGSDAARSLLILAAAAALWLATPGLWLLVVLALVFGVVDALFMPAVGALPTRITSRGELMRLLGFKAFVDRMGRLAGPPTAGFALGVGGPEAAFAAAGVLFALSLALLIAVRIAPVLPDDAAATGAQRTSAWRELRDGLRYVRRHPVVGPLVVSGAISQIGISPPLTVGIVLLGEERGWSPAGVGLILGTMALGAGISTLGLAVAGRFPRAGLWATVTLAVASVAIGAIGLLPTVAGAAAVALLAGLVSGICGGLSSTLIQANTEPGYLGRVSSVMAFTAVGLTPLFFPVGGWAAGVWGAQPLFVVGGAVSMAAALLPLAARAVWHAELPDKR
ncbi:MFS transporter [Streptomyces sp. N35]|uniref:MFS transporter n=1 Tax=Streptomyces sp. N35 TaxID=2795730 RepID=UPI0018F74372|nr:MFS transporter [Streptomyces sp. N35]